MVKAFLTLRGWLQTRRSSPPKTHGTVHRFQCTSVGTPREKAWPRSGDVWEIPASERAALEDKAAAATAVEGAGGLPSVFADGEVPHFKAVEDVERRSKLNPWSSRRTT